MPPHLHQGIGRQILGPCSGGALVDVVEHVLKHDILMRARRGEDGRDEQPEKFEQTLSIAEFGRPRFALAHPVYVRRRLRSACPALGRIVHPSTLVGRWELDAQAARIEAHRQQRPSGA